MFRNFYYPAVGLEDRIKETVSMWTNTMRDIVGKLFMEGVSRGEFKKTEIVDLIWSYFRFARAYYLQFKETKHISTEEEIKKTWELYILGIKVE